MKQFLFAAMMVLSFATAAYADDDCHRGHTNGQCDDDKYFTCSVRDGHGNFFEEKSNGFWEQNIVQYRAMKRCRAQSSAPRTCRPLGCQKDPW
jgi:hypothetical protein